MKKGYWACSVLLSILLGIVWLADLFLWHDLQTGFITKGDIWVRYLLFMVPLFPIVSFSPPAKGEFRTLYGEKNKAIRLFLNLCAGIFVLCGLYGLVQNALASKIANAVLGVLCVLMGVWLYRFKVCLSEKIETPTKTVFGGFGLCLYFYGVLTVRFLGKPSSLHRLIPTVHTLSGVAAIGFVFVLILGSYLPGEKLKGRKVYIWGQLCFLFGLCLTLPIAVYEVMMKSQSILSVIISLLPEMLFGILGAAVSYKMFPPKEESFSQRYEV